MTDQKPDPVRPPAEVSVGTPNDDTDVNDAIMNGGSGPGALPAVPSGMHDAPRMDDVDRSPVDPAGANTASQVPTGGTPGS